jgi:N-terminal domain of anti-restriction factor ArdC
MANATRKRKSTEERRAQVAGLRDRLEAWQELTDAGLIAEYLARFDGYWPRNAMLIAMQCPHATEVRGFKAWLAEGRCVRRGEHGIQILAPMPDREEEKRADEARDRGEEMVRKGLRCRIAYVFDVAQTDELSAPGSGS